MTDDFSVKIEGLNELETLLNSLGGKELDKCMRVSLQAGAKVTQAAITELVPVNETGGGLLPKGALKSDVMIENHRFKDGTPYCVVTYGKYTRYVGRLVEWGHRLIRGGYNKLNKSTGKMRGPGKVIGTVPEKAYVRKGFEASEQAAEAVIASTWTAAIEKAATKQGK